MLKKKHEEAKEILVRAVVNNNKLLMLNHSIYEEKISYMISPIVIIISVHFLTEFVTKLYLYILYSYILSHDREIWCLVVVQVSVTFRRYQLLRLPS